jgi:site-specific recombinase XerD
MKFSVPYLQMRGGRPRWVPGPKLRAAGWKGRDLKSEGGEWLNEADAITAAKAINAEVVAAAEAPVAKVPSRAKNPRAVEVLVEAWKISPRFLRKAKSTRDEYLNKIGIFCAEFGDKHVAAISKADLYTWWEELYRDRGHAMANGTIGVVRVFFSYCVMKAWRNTNPAKSLGLETLPPRVVVWSPSEVKLFVETADEMGLTEIADAVVLALHTGQRQGDVLELVYERTRDERCVFKQRKTGARVTVPFTPALAARLAGIRARRAAEPVTALATIVVLDPETGERFDRFKFGKLFRQVREKAAAKCHETGNKEPLCPHIAEKQFGDTRDTAVTRLALAGSTIPEIRAITGHSLETVHSILEHYLALDDRMAAEGIRKLKQYMVDEGIAI